MKKKTSNILNSKLFTSIAGILMVCLAVFMVAFGIYRGVKGRRPPAKAPAPVIGDDITVTDQEEAPTENSDRALKEQIAKMTIRQKICQLFIVTPEILLGEGYDEVTAAGPATEAALEQYPVGGLIYFSQNLESVEQTEKMLSNTKAYGEEIIGIPLFISVDEEGGDIARCADKLGTTQLEPMYAYRGEGEEKAYENAQIIANDIGALGFNLDFAPVADTWSNPLNTVIGRRAYSDDFNEAALLSAAAVRGFNDSGVLCCIKHFPGHGDTLQDSHEGSAYSDKTIDELIGREYQAFENCIAAGADMVMVGHITMTEIDNLPASLSPVMIGEELRGRLGYEGVVITDSLKMGAAADIYTTGELCVKAFLAGSDILLLPENLSEAAEAMENAVNEGLITEERLDESLLRILRLKKKIG